MRSMRKAKSWCARFLIIMVSMASVLETVAQTTTEAPPTSSKPEIPKDVFDDEFFENLTEPPNLTQPVGGSFDKYMELALVNLGRMMKEGGFDPYNLGQLLVCTNCSLEGLSLVQRTGPATMFYQNQTVVLDANIGWPMLFVTCFCTQRILLVSFAGTLEVTLWGLEVYVKFEQKTSRGATPKLLKYTVTKEGEFDVDLKGSGLLGPVTEIGFKVLFRRQVAEVIRQFVYETGPNILKQQLEKVSLPLGRR